MNEDGFEPDEIDFIIKDLRASMTLIAGTIAELTAKKKRLERWERLNKIKEKRK